MQDKFAPVTLIKKQLVRQKPARAAARKSRLTPRGGLPRAVSIPPAPTPFMIFGIRQVTK